MKNTIIFKIQIAEKYGGFAQASNFITKIHEEKSIEVGEVQGINSIQLKSGRGSLLDMANYVIDHFDDFKPITKPEYLNRVVGQYQVAYCFWIEDESLQDVIDIQYDCLIKKFFIPEKIFTILSGTQGLYFKTSHYLFDVSEKHPDIYNSIYYVSDKENGFKKLIRLQKKNVGSLMNFMPLYYFSEEKNVLFDKLKERISCEVLRMVFSGVLEQTKEESPTMRGCLKLLKGAGRHLSEKDLKRVIDLLGEGNVLTFLLFSYSFSGKFWREEFEFEDIKCYFEKMEEYALGCEQLVENVLHHSTAKCGCVSIRFHEMGSQYIKKHYGKGLGDSAYWEILITDYAGINTYGNLADNFRLNLDENYKNDFSELQPVDFLVKFMEDSEHEKTARGAFHRYNRCSENIGKHIGLKIFRGIVEENEGIFGFYSHRGHMLNKGENYRFQDYEALKSSVQCIPGTGYRVLLPLKKQSPQISRSEIGIDHNNYLERNVTGIRAGYFCENMELKSEEFFYDGQQEKEIMISRLAKRLYKRRSENSQQRIIYISAVGLVGEVAEYIGKALLIASYEKSIADFVFYGCSDDFVKNFQKTMAVYFGIKELQYVYKNNEFVIALYKKQPIEGSFIIPGHYQKTLWVNRTNCFAGNELAEIGWLLPHKSIYSEEECLNKEIPPYDILYGVEGEGNGKTIFEQYTLQVLETDIQNRAFGCKISDTHMRLGSTIHIDCFYEAELLFNNRLFASRFAYLLVREMIRDTQFVKAEKITLYSYALYSETLIVETINILENLYPEKDLDYSILERESEHREFTHVDRIRYSTSFTSKEKQEEYFKDRKIVCIVPINSTLKTHEKLISLFCEDNPKVNLSEQLILNYALILVGSKENNQYWGIDEEKRTFDQISLNIHPMPHYFIAVKVEYYEALGCELCFPQNPLDEVPLVEVNAASTIPNQSLGLYGKGEDGDFSYEQIQQEEHKLTVLKDSLMYSHIQRGENHYLYYFKTDELFLKHKLEIIEWLKEIENIVKAKADEYHILFCPAHFSNAGFLECVNRFVFHDAALIIRVDVDKEYRSNICVKYSNLAMLVDLLSKEQNKGKVIKVHYIDDSIVTGRTFYRAKSLISSVVDRYKEKENQIDIHIFEKIFVLLDRNSKQSRLQYIGCWDSRNKRVEQLENSFFAYRTLCISSMRNHGDSCILCQLERESKLLYQTSATRQMAEYWKGQNEKFSVSLLRDKQEENKVGNRYEKEEKNISPNKAFRRMACNHIATLALSGERHGNRKEKAVLCLLQLLITDFEGRKKEKGNQEAFEYFMSYLKIISRPFMVFDKTIKEAVFDVQLFLVESLLGKEDTKIILDESKKKYLKKAEESFDYLVNHIVREDFNKGQKLDLLQLLFKQLTEMKSNYFIRIENISKMAKFAETYEGTEQTELFNRYLQQVKKLLGVSSDTSKSAWFSRELSKVKDTLGLPKSIYERLVLENTRAYFDGMERLCRNLQWNKETSDFLCSERWYGPEKEFFDKYKNSVDGNNSSISNDDLLKLLKENIRNDKEVVAKREICSLTENNVVDKLLEKSSKLNVMYKNDSERPEIKNLLDLVNRELKKTQYRDFSSLLKDSGLGDRQVSVDGVIQLTAGIELLNLCNVSMKEKRLDSTEKNIEELCFNIASLIEKILRSKDVKILLECPLECDKWEDDMRKYFNEMVKHYLGEQEDGLKLELENRKEYLVIADSGKEVGAIEGVETKIAERLTRYNKQEENDHTGFYVNENEVYLVWEMGNGKNTKDKTRKLLIYVEFYELEFPKDWNLLRNLFCLNYILNKSVFNDEVIDYLFELILADKERLMYNLDKAHSHTAAGVRSVQCDWAKKKMNGEDNLYRSFVLTLLSDLQVSQVYRNSLKEDYYCKKVEICPRTCGNIFEAFYQGNPLTALNQAEREMRNNICIEFPDNVFGHDQETQLKVEDKILTYDEAKGGNEVFLLIFALIMNAAGPNRGKKETDPITGKCESQIKVFLTKTKEGCLRIANKCEMMTKSVSQINAELRFPPQRDNGISLWSVSRFVRGMISVLLQHRILKTKEILEDMESIEKREEALNRLYLLIEKFLSSKFFVKVDIKEDEEGIKYFYMDIPILFEKYKELFD